MAFCSETGRPKNGNGEISGLDDWFQTPPGRYLLEWERTRFDAALADVFGYHALQIGAHGIDALIANRMPHRWLALTAPPLPVSRVPPVALVADSKALPFAEASLDLVVLPHTLEISSNPHATLREVQRVLVHEGRVAIAGLNPASLWGLRQRRAQGWCRLGLGQWFLPEGSSFIGHWRLRDWLRLLEFEVESISFGCYRPAVRGERALARFGWMECVGARWWPIFGAAYLIVAVKRTRGAKLVGPAWKAGPAVVGTPAPVANRERKPCH
jgi:SAM-dependent methyltransferase